MRPVAGKRSASTPHVRDESLWGEMACAAIVTHLALSLSNFTGRTDSYHMKKGIHPEYYPEAKVVCSCGNTFTTGSTQELIRTDVCSACHPFFTGEQRIVDSAGQVERFMKRLEKREEFVAEEKAHPEEAEEATAKTAKTPKKKLDEAEAAKAVAEKLRGKEATAEKSAKEASGKPADKAAKSSAKKSGKEATTAKKTKRKKATKKEAATSEESR
jgi:large subunit ribosomal protein L31